MPLRRLVACLGAFCVMLALPARAGQETLAVYFFSRPPFYISGSQPGPACRGLVLERTCRVLEEAGIAYYLQELPVKRSLQEIKRGQYGCGVGWYKLAPRLAFANFSLPLFRGLPLAIIINRRRAGELPVRPTLEQVLRSPLNRGVVAGYSYGQWADSQLASLHPSTVSVSGTSANMLRMVASGRCDYWLINTEEARWLLDHHPHLAHALEFRPLADAPPGENRHLMCSKSVPLEVLRRIDRAIAHLYGAPPAAP
ncbi:MAG: transporter substrate-binding domain-containing protein [Pseudomonadota bacterium]